MLGYTLAAAPAARALRWHDEAALQRVAQRLGDGMAGWAQDWGLGTAEWVCRNAWDEPKGASAPWQALGAVDDGAAVWLGQSPETLIAGLSQALYGGAVAAGSLAQELAQQAAQALPSALAAALGGRLGHGDGAALDAACWRPWSGAVHATCRSAGVELCSLLIWPQEQPEVPLASTRGALVSLSTALADHPQRVRATLHEVPLRLGDLMGLSLGDVLVTSHALTQPLRVDAVSDTRKTYFSAHLGQHDGRMAVTLVA